MKKPALANKLRPYGLDGPTALGRALGTTRQYADQLLRGRRAYGVKTAKKIGAAIGLPFTLILEWQENGR